MVALTRKEIIAELKRFGINAPSELNICLREYSEYCRVRQPHNYYLLKRVIPEPLILKEIKILSNHGTEADIIDPSTIIL